VIVTLTTLPSRVVYPGTTLRARVRFSDEITDADQTPAAVVFLLRPASSASSSPAEYTWTNDDPAPVVSGLDATVTAITRTVSGGALVFFEATVAIPSDATPGTWTFAWRALDDDSNQLATQWGAVDVEPEASGPLQPSPVAPPPNPDVIGADVYAYGYPPGYWYR